MHVVEEKCVDGFVKMPELTGIFLQIWVTWSALPIFCYILADCDFVGIPTEKVGMTNVCSLRYTIGAAEERRFGLETNEKEMHCPATADEYIIDERQVCVAREMIRGAKCLEEILAEYSVDDDEFTSWMLDGHFAKYAENLARAYAEMKAPRVWRALVEEAESGKIPAIKLYLDVWAKNHAQSTGICAPSDDMEDLRDEIFGPET